VVTVRRRFPTPPAFRDNDWEPPRIQDFSEDLGPGSAGTTRRSAANAETIGHMRPPDTSKLKGMHAWSKSQAAGGVPDGQMPPRNKGKGWQKMSIHGPE
jgi:hypothetical protein